MKNNSKKSGKNASIFVTKDPVVARVMLIVMIVAIVLAFAVSIASVAVLSNTAQHSGLFYMGGKYYTPLTDPVSGQETNYGGIFQPASSYVVNDQVGYLHYVKGQACVSVYTVTNVNGDTYNLDIDGRIVTGVKKDYLLGKYTGKLTSGFALSLADDPTMFLLLSIGFAALALVAALLHFLVSPRGAKKFEKKEENEAVPATVARNDNAALLMQYLSTDDNIRPYEADESEAGAVLNTNYYNSVRLHDGEVYTVVKKYPEAASILEEYGASDMDIIKMNMIGNSEFDNLILIPHKEKTLSLQEVIDFTSALEGVYCIKKRGTLNWTFKYKSKTVLIIKENDDKSGYKVAVKVYPDAATKLNIVYKALEDSTFPIGPFWFMFNNLRNLSGNVIQWLIRESYRISIWQQIKADLLRDTPSLESLKVDVLAIRTAVLSTTPYTDMGKFAVITQDAQQGNVRYETVLETGFGDHDMADFTKEYTMNIPSKEGYTFSLLTRKSATETLCNALCNEMLALCSQEAAPEQRRPQESEAQPKIVRRSATVRKKTK